ncbi:hypothetical protein [Chondrinema litorale]|uniref:hypothetical protein n=1 Tax=Chondrinema litorale TaxID=2994555 RepID=UPI0025433BC1|nr:hypothetical protein [Chondrinema litorale]UZS00252.1 hypothetical protein OQ292_40640 [Chondrinema litorale]
MVTLTENIPELQGTLKELLLCWASQETDLDIDERQKVVNNYRQIESVLEEYGTWLEYISPLI